MAGWIDSRQSSWQPAFRLPAITNDEHPRLQSRFRLSTIDVIVLVAGAITASALATLNYWSWGFVIAFVLGHFFLFCNVVRMARPLGTCVGWRVSLC